MSIYDYIVKDGSGQDVALSDYKGKVLLIVNTATGCGFTPQYEGLQALYEKYADRGFEILDFPCNQFAKQAPGTDEEIAAFCTGRYGVTFPQFHKIDVNGANADPLYKFLRSEASGVMGSKIKWNFTKFLVDRNGNVVARYAPSKTPKSLESPIENLLNHKT
ncbi:MAG: glutathione peroxidase [Clostridiales bacterium]|nr:glutathione peroxidase [Clostridiales bacterium]